MGLINKAISSLNEKLNPGQYLVAGGGINSAESSSSPTNLYTAYYESLEVVNRGVNMLVDDAAEIPFKIEDKLDNSVIKYKRKKELQKLLNEWPNPYQDVSTFKRNLYIDLIIDGNMFIYYDGKYMYHLPACKVTIHKSSVSYIEKFTMGDVTYWPNEIIHIKDNSFDSMYRGLSRLKPAIQSMKLIKEMKDFQHQFFKNGAVPGLIITSPDTLSQKIKDRFLASWTQKYNAKGGGKRPMFLDGGLKVDSLSNVNFKEMDFENSIDKNETIILKTLGVPPILLDSGNNANLRPNLRLYYLETVLPAVKKLNSGLERFFGYTVYEDITHVPALQPELKDQSAYFVGLTNGGIITPNEARTNLGFDEIEGHSDLRIPANIAGSASNPDEGGAPPSNPEEED